MPYETDADGYIKVAEGVGPVRMNIVFRAEPPGDGLSISICSTTNSTNSYAVGLSKDQAKELLAYLTREAQIRRW